MADPVLRHLRTGPVLQGAVLALLTAGVGLALGLGAKGSTRTAIFTVLAIVGFVLGGFRAGIDAGHAPLVNGAAAAALAYAPMAVVRLAQELTGDENARWGAAVTSTVFALLLAASIGTLGGLLANSAVRRRSA